ncbi:DDE-type integrase/transposase/recombinase [Haloechinothrix halophila]|uniref:DDE-type integrase/transposase/recombinase n=1 Tax=Haloechinothrix halophila TaxID=1069073 RepID=UPI0012F73D33|nr:DDE-type integrase/transposase/recombinase [Haloechinothrix halophila]
MAEQVVAMEIRLLVALAGRPGQERVNVTALCAELGISRDTFYRYRRRFDGRGLEGVLPRSRRPHHSPGQTPDWLEELIVATRHELDRQGWDCGARSIRYRLLRRGISPSPTARTIHRVLVRRGEITPAPQKRPRSSWRRFEFAEPNGCWQIDGTEWHLADGTPAVILRVLDDCSRKTLASRAAVSENAADAWGCMLTALTRHGRPAILLSDGGAAFTARHRGGWAAFEANLRALAITPAVASPHHPQTCGKKEREWQTLKRWLRARPTAANLTELQQQLDLYDAAYNALRPHQALDGHTPDERYAQRHTTSDNNDDTPPAPLPPLPVVRDVKASTTGTVAIGRHQQAQVGIQWQHAQLTVFRDGNRVAIFHRDHLVRALDADPNRRYQPLGSRPGPPRRPRLALPNSPLPHPQLAEARNQPNHK